jgi:hypothetical protein
MWDRPADLNEPPEYVTVDIDRTLNADRVVLATPRGMEQPLDAR